jgi:hypothetical protein
MENENLTTIAGEIVTVNPVRRGLAIRSINTGITTGFKWDPAQDKEFIRLRPGWSAIVTIEKRGQEWIAISQQKGPRLPGRQVPESPRATYLVLIKKWTDLYIACNALEGVDFDHARQAIMASAKQDLPEAMRAGSGA